MGHWNETTTFTYHRSNIKKLPSLQRFTWWKLPEEINFGAHTRATERQRLCSKGNVQVTTTVSLVLSGHSGHNLDPRQQRSDLEDYPGTQVTPSQRVTEVSLGHCSPVHGRNPESHLSFPPGQHGARPVSPALPSGKASVLPSPAARTPMSGVPLRRPPPTSQRPLLSSPLFPLTQPGNTTQ